MRRLISLLVLTFLPLAALPSCSGRGTQDAGDWVFERETIGDTIVVRTLAGSIWGEPARLEEETSIGALEGREEEMFGFIQGIAVDADGGVYAFDGQVPALRYFDAEGTYVRTVGGEGGGPGEYYDASLGLAMRSDGRLVMRDPRNARLNVYNPDGTSSDHWPVASGLFSPQATTIDTADHLYLKILLGRPPRNSPWPISLLHLDAAGQIVDTLHPPHLTGEPTTTGGSFGTSKIWAYSPLGYFVVGVNDQYSFELHPPNGPVVRIQRVVETVRLNPEEKEEMEARNRWTEETQGQFMTSDIPPVPETKPAYRGFYIGTSGRIWVHRHTDAVKVETDLQTEPDPNRPPPRTWREPVVFDVFEPDGTYLGEVPVPRRTQIAIFGPTHLWGIRQGEMDEPYIVRYRIESPPGDGGS